MALALFKPKRLGVFLALGFSTLQGIGTSFLTVPSSPREAGLGGSSVSVMGDPSLARGNPALIIQGIPATQVYLGYHEWIAGIEGSSILLVQPGLGGIFGFGIRQLMISDLELRTGTPTDEFVAQFSASGTAIEIIWGRGSGGGKPRFGGTVRWIRSDLYVYSSSGLAFDLGAVWPVIQDRLVLGTAVRNMGFMGPLKETELALPTSLSAAASYKFPFLETTKRLNLTSELTLGVESSRVHGTVTRFSGETGLGAFRLTIGSRFSRNVSVAGASLAVTWRRFEASYGVEVGSHRLGIPHLFQVTTTLP